MLNRKCFFLFCFSVIGSIGLIVYCNSCSLGSKGNIVILIAMIITLFLVAVTGVLAISNKRK